MDVDLDTFYEEFKALRDRLAPVLAMFEQHQAAASQAPSNPSAARAMAQSHVEKGLLDWAGRLLGLDRVTVAGGHGFDEDDTSFERRLRSDLGMMQRPDEVQGVLKEYSSAEELDAILNKPEPGNVDVKVNDDGSATQLRTDGPTVAEYVSAGFAAKTYPPGGYASKSTQEEIDSAIAYQDGQQAPQGDQGPVGEKAPEPPADQPPAQPGVNVDAPPVGPGNET